MKCDENYFQDKCRVTAEAASQNIEIPRGRKVKWDLFIILLFQGSRILLSFSRNIYFKFYLYPLQITLQIARKSRAQTTEPAYGLELVLFVTVQKDLQASTVKRVSKKN